MLQMAEGHWLNVRASTFVLGCYLHIMVLPFSCTYSPLPSVLRPSPCFVSVWNYGSVDMHVVVFMLHCSLRWGTP